MIPLICLAIISMLSCRYRAGMGIMWVSWWHSVGTVAYRTDIALVAWYFRTCIVPVSSCNRTCIALASWYYRAFIMLISLRHRNGILESCWHIKGIMEASCGCLVGIELKSRWYNACVVPVLWGIVLISCCFQAGSVLPRY